MSPTEFQAKRVVKSYRQTIDAPPEVVFPLLCPVREAEWLDGWQYKMIYSASGLAEEGAVFSTANPGEEDIVWVVTRHDPETRVVEFTRFTPRCKTCVLRIGVAPFDEGRSYVDVTYTYTSIAPGGNQFLESWTQESFLEAVVFWERSMNHFLKTGSRLRHAAS
jgi:hypothetical protein